MTLNERCAKCLGWEVVEHNMGHNKDYFDKYGTPVMPVESFHPDTDRNHSHLMVEAVREAEKEKQFCNALDLVLQRFHDRELWRWLYIHTATPAQISKAACEVL